MCVEVKNWEMVKNVELSLCVWKEEGHTKKQTGL